VDPAHAPVPVSDAERLVFAQLYEPLVHVDCAGRVVTGLADSWRVDSGGRRWTFTLRRDAQFWDGAPVTAQDVIASWRGRDSLLAGQTTALGPRDVRVGFTDSSFINRLTGGLPAVTKPSPDRGWPIGTGPYWMSGSAVTGALVAQPVARPWGGPVIAFRDVSGSDPRDVLEGGGIDLVLTDDPTVVSYAGSRPQYAALPLVWDRTYVLAMQGGPAPEVDRQDLVSAVHAEAKAAEGRPCPAADAGEATAARPILPLRRLVFDRTDRTAREVAERLVARGALGAGVPAAGLAPAEFAAALRSNNAWAYITAVPSAAECLTGPAAGEQRVRALVAVRRYAIVRRGIPRLLLDADGALRLVPR
jgi:hypothetical protein